MDQPPKVEQKAAPGHRSSTAKSADTLLLPELPAAVAAQSKPAVPATIPPPGNVSPAHEANAPLSLSTLDAASLASLAQRYQILGEAGRGNMGIVYKARDKETGEVVALKVLKPEIASAEKTLDRFKNELLFARKITHKNVCRVYEFNRVGEIAYTSMEYVQGKSLRVVLNRCGACPEKMATEIALQICAGLREAHAQGIVHRDLKPENVMIDPQQNVKIMDFGIARSMEAGARLTNSFVGTPAYMAPEQVAGKSLDYRADIYSLGLVLYEMYTGAPTFTAENPVAIAVMQMRQAPVPPHQIKPDLPVAIERTILKCLEKEPAKRFHSIEDLEKALRSSEAPALAPVPKAAEQRRPAKSLVVAPRSVKSGARSQESAMPAAWIILGAALTLGALAGARWIVQAQSAEQIPAPPPVATPKPPRFALESPPPAPKPASQFAPQSASQPASQPASKPVAGPASQPANSRPDSPSLEALAEPGSSAKPGSTPAPAAAQPNAAPSAPAAKNPQSGRGSQDATNTASPGQFLLAGRFGREDKANERADQLKDQDLPANVIVRHPGGHPAVVYLVVTGPFGQKRAAAVKQQLEDMGIQNVQFFKVPELSQAH